MKALLRTAVVCIALTASAGVTYADWAIGDPFKMHFPQLPDPNGWDVNAEELRLADDWLCTESGPVSDVHLWVSWQADQFINPRPVGISLTIWDNMPAGVGAPWSMPRNPLWSRIVPAPEIIVGVPPGFGDQGWYDPSDPLFLRPDHNFFWQLNMTKIPDPFIQQLGNIYWLEVSIFDPDNIGLVGWKTSVNHFEDDAVWFDVRTGMWTELRDPFTGQSLDLAFVITPEPGSLLLLSLGMVALVTVRRRQR